MQAFAQFGSDLDNATKSILDHGQKVREVLKQGQYSPRSVESQVITLFALKNGFTKTIEVNQINEFMDGLLQHIKMNHPEYFTEIVETKVISNELEDKLKDTMEKYVLQFKKTSVQG